MPCIDAEADRAAFGRGGIGAEVAVAFPWRCADRGFQHAGEWHSGLRAGIEERAGKPARERRQL